MSCMDRRATACGGLCCSRSCSPSRFDAASVQPSAQLRWSWGSPGTPCCVRARMCGVVEAPWDSAGTSILIASRCTMCQQVPPNIAPPPSPSLSLSRRRCVSRSVGSCISDVSALDTERALAGGGLVAVRCRRRSAGRQGGRAGAFSHAHTLGSALSLIWQGFSFGWEGKPLIWALARGPAAEQTFWAKARAKYLSRVAHIHATGGLAQERVAAYVMFASSVLHYLAQLMPVLGDLQRQMRLLLHHFFLRPCGLSPRMLFERSRATCCASTSGHYRRWLRPLRCDSPLCTLS